MSRIFHRLVSAIVCLQIIALGFSAQREPLRIEDARILERSDVRFPATMRVTGIEEGHVSVVLMIDERGQPVDTFVVESSRRAFARSALKSIETWKFAAAKYNGQAFPSSIRIDLDFQLGSQLAWQTFKAPVQTNITQTGRREKPTTSRAIQELDAIPLPLKMVEPSDDVAGKATIEFYIDELGNARCPKLVSGDNLEYGRALLDAVLQWQFQAPMAGGVKTNTLVRQSFQSGDEELTSSASP